MNGNECMNANRRDFLKGTLPTGAAALMLAFATLTIGAADGGALGERALPETAPSDDLPTSVVMWVCPDEPFAAGIGKARHYRKAFETKDGLVKATARWWVDDDGAVFVDGDRMPQSAMTVNQPVDLTAI